MALVTFKEVKDLALDLADVTGDPHVDPTFLSQHAQFAFGELHDLVVGADERYLVKTTTFAPTSDVREFDLPKDFYKFLKVWYISDADGRRHPMRHVPLDQIDAWHDCQPRYTYMGNQIIFTRGFTHEVEVKYVPLFTEMRHDTDVCNVDIPWTWVYYVVLWLAYYLKVRNDLDTTQIQQLLDRQRALIQQVAEDRDTGEADAQVDIYGFTRRSRWGGYIR